MLRKIGVAIQRANKWLVIYVSGVCMLLIMTLLIVDASLRTLWGLVLLWTMDVVEILLAWVVFTAFAYALITGAHVRMTLVVARLPARLRSGCEIFGNLMGVGFFGVLTFRARSFFWESFLVKEVPMAVVGTPLWLGKLALLIGTSLMLVVFLFRLIRSLHPKREVIEEEKEARF